MTERHDFIEVYEQALSADTCRALIERFERSGQAQRGQTGSGHSAATRGDAASR